MIQDTYIIHDGESLDEQLATIIAAIGGGKLMTDSAVDLAIDPNDCDDPECPFCELEALRHWEEEALQFRDEVRLLQELGKSMNPTLGERIQPAILPHIESLNKINEMQSAVVLKMGKLLHLNARVVDAARKLQGPVALHDYTDIEDEFDAALAALDAESPKPTENGIFGAEIVTEDVPPPEPLTVRRNRIKCVHCEDVIESTYRHDFKWCKCGKVAVDGGKDYHKRCFGTDDDFVEMP